MSLGSRLLAPSLSPRTHKEVKLRVGRYTLPILTKMILSKLLYDFYFGISLKKSFKKKKKALRKGN